MICAIFLQRVRFGGEICENGRFVSSTWELNILKVGDGPKKRDQVSLPPKVRGLAGMLWFLNFTVNFHLTL